MSQAFSEQEVRQLRSKVLGGECADHTWQIVRENWMRPDSIAWLIERSKIELSDFRPRCTDCGNTGPKVVDGRCKPSCNFN